MVGWLDADDMGLDLSRGVIPFFPSTGRRYVRRKQEGVEVLLRPFRPVKEHEAIFSVDGRGRAIANA